MATLQLIWEGRGYGMWSWVMGNTHLDAQTIRRVQNNVYLACMGPHGAAQLTKMVIAKMARGSEDVYSLARESEFYNNELYDLQGIVVPRFFGFFRGKQDGVDVACLLLEYCSGYAPTTESEKEEQNRGMMVAVCKLHQVGVVHGSLVGGRHFVRMGEGLRIIDFSLAVTHKCPNGIPILTTRSHTKRDVVECSELALLERTWGFRNDRAAEQRNRFDRIGKSRGKRFDT